MGAIDSTERDPNDFTCPLQVSAKLSNLVQAKIILLFHWLTALRTGNRREEFESAVSELAQKHHLELPLILNALNGTRIRN